MGGGEGMSGNLFLCYRRTIYGTVIKKPGFRRAFFTDLADGDVFADQYFATTGAGANQLKW
ncbi:hypothetical protein AMST5_00642 [freshwater sediment metagenome]|uniref:Uncharacterized protein n=1 Tax=freshwater sediment metagenome TaxID=556182 RepID=A0AA48M029_9ZZZZ